MPLFPMAQQQLLCASRQLFYSLTLRPSEQLVRATEYWYTLLAVIPNYGCAGGWIDLCFSMLNLLSFVTSLRRKGR